MRRSTSPLRRHPRAITGSVMEAPAWSHANGLGEQFAGMVQTDEEFVTNATTTVSGQPISITGSGTNCATTTWLPASASFSATITGLNTFTTATNPATLFPVAPLGIAGYGRVWDLGASGLMNQVAMPLSWTGPAAGVYTVAVGDCFAGEGTLPLRYGIPVYSCFNATSGSLTLYALQNAVTLSSNTTTAAAISVPANPALFGLAVGDTIFDASNATNPITSITGSGPYTINTSCSPASGNCFTPSDQQIDNIGVVSGTYNSSTGAVVLTLGASTTIASGTTFKLVNAGGTGSVASLDGNYTAASGTSGTTLNFTAATSLGSITISGGQVDILSPLSTLSSSVDLISKNGPIQLVASTTGTGCDGANVLCGIANSPVGAFLGQGAHGARDRRNLLRLRRRGAALLRLPERGQHRDRLQQRGGHDHPRPRGTFTTPAVFTYTTDGSGHVNGGTVTTSGIYSGPLPKAFTQASTSSTGTGATYQFGYPTPIIGNGSSGKLHGHPGPAGRGKLHQRFGDQPSLQLPAADQHHDHRQPRVLGRHLSPGVGLPTLYDRDVQQQAEAALAAPQHVKQHPRLGRVERRPDLERGLQRHHPRRH